MPGRPPKEQGGNINTTSIFKRFIYWISKDREKQGINTEFKIKNRPSGPKKLK